jgi:imidazolonepropionase
VPKFTLVRGARQLLTLRGSPTPRCGTDLQNLAILQDGALLIADGRIQEIGPSRRIENLSLARQAHEIDATGRVVMPGFIDCHTHIAGGPARLFNHNSPIALARAIQELSPRTLETQALLALSEAVRHGTTTLESKSGFGLTEANEIKILRVHAALEKRSIPLISTCLCAHLPPEFLGHPDRYIDWACSHLLPLLKRRKLAEFAEISCQENSFSADQARRFLAAARQLKFHIKVHLGRRPSWGAIRMAIASGAACLDHLTDLTPNDAALLAQSQTIATILPGPDFYLGTQDSVPARKLIDSGVPIALATGYHPETSPSQSMPMMIALACANLKLTAAEAVAAATINAAHAVGKASAIGSLEAGKSADLLILSVPDYREIPYHFGVNLVALVMKNGEVLLQRSEVKWPAR